MLKNIYNFHKINREHLLGRDMLWFTLKEAKRDGWASLSAANVSVRVFVRRQARGELQRFGLGASRQQVQTPRHLREAKNRGGTVQAAAWGLQRESSRGGKKKYFIDISLIKDLLQLLLS